VGSTANKQIKWGNQIKFPEGKEKAVRSDARSFNETEKGISKQQGEKEKKHGREWKDSNVRRKGKKN